MTELIRNFGIDWKLLLSQAINFFVLLLILRKFAYTPILHTLRRRKEEIEKGLRFAKEAEARLKEIEKVGEEMVAQSRREALAIVTKAEEQARARSEEILAETEKRAQALIQEAKRFIEEEKAKMGEGIRAEAEELVRLGIGRVLGAIPPEVRDRVLIREALRELAGSVK